MVKYHLVFNFLFLDPSLTNSSWRMASADPVHAACNTQAVGDNSVISCQAVLHD